MPRQAIYQVDIERAKLQFASIPSIVAGVAMAAYGVMLLTDKKARPHTVALFAANAVGLGASLVGVRTQYRIYRKEKKMPGRW